jgi:hypothetical protein
LLIETARLLVVFEGSVTSAVVVASIDHFISTLQCKRTTPPSKNFSDTQVSLNFF